MAKQLKPSILDNMPSADAKDAVDTETTTLNGKAEDSALSASDVLDEEESSDAMIKNDKAETKEEESQDSSDTAVKNDKAETNDDEKSRDGENCDPAEATKDQEEDEGGEEEKTGGKDGAECADDEPPAKKLKA